MIGRALAVGIICAPFISTALLALARAARALHYRRGVPVNAVIAIAGLASIAVLFVDLVRRTARLATRGLR